MKTMLLLLAGLFILSGCSTKSQNSRLRTINAKQAVFIEKQKKEIRALRSKLKTRHYVKKRRKPKIRKKIVKRKQTVKRKQVSRKIPKAPKKHIKLKKVEDTNYSSGYMYPGAKKKSTPLASPAPVVTHVTTPPAGATATISAPAPTVVKPAPVVSAPAVTSMSRGECISMIGAEKFAKYTQMFGSEAASIKRCRILKSMRQ